MHYILIADDQEANEIKVPKELKGKVEKIVIGYGEYNALKTITQLMLKGKFTKNDKFYNVGYVGSNEFEVGKVVPVGKVDRETPSKFAKTKAYTLDSDYKVKCYTANDFVEDSKHTGIFDMELYVLATIFPKIKSVKVVSDNLNYKQYKKVSLKNSWKLANALLWNYVNSADK